MLPIFSVLADVVLSHRTSRNSEKDALKVVRTKLTDTGEGLLAPIIAYICHCGAWPCVSLAILEHLMSS